MTTVSPTSRTTVNKNVKKDCDQPVTILFCAKIWIMTKKGEI